MKIVVVSGGFDPVHAGHIELFKQAKNLGDILIVALNSDKWLSKKKGKPFMGFDERKLILESISVIDYVIAFEDDNLGSCKNALHEIKRKYPKDEIIFCNGGDRNNNNIPEMDLEGINFKFGVGGNEKINSSSSILKKYFFNKTNRIWGSFYELFHESNVKVKELIIEPQKGISYQRHFFRNEIWFIYKGECKVKYSKSKPEESKTIKLKKNDLFLVKQNEWHQLINESDCNCHIIEIQFGDKLSELDIERRSFYINNES